MDLSFKTESGRLVCELTDGSVHATVTAADAEEAAADFLTAVTDAHQSDVSECFWHEAGGDYRWMFCRRGDRVDVAVMWCAGVITGWQHVFRAECPTEELEAAILCVRPIASQ